VDVWAVLSATLAGASLLAWLVIAALPARPWDLRPVGEDEPLPPEPPTWPPVCVVVPAHNECAYLPRTLPALLAQDYPGTWRVVVVDDRSDDGTADVAVGLEGPAGRLGVVRGGTLPQGWAGKVWAMAQGAELAGPAGEPAAGAVGYLLLTDADILHRPGSLRRLVAESEAGELALNSRMARLHTASGAERLLVPPFLFFFNLLYPMRLVNGPGRTAAAAGGCILLRRDALGAIGGFAAIRGEIIDDVNLAKAVKATDRRIRLCTSRGDVTSLRAYGTVRALWRTVRRTAYDELRYSPLLLLGTVAGLALLFVVPPAAVLLAVAWPQPAGPWRVGPGLTGALAWAAMALIFLPTVRFFGLRPPWALTLPLAGVLYAGMTIDSAVRHVLGRGGRW
jgi:hopene-associated glycosyltransferase HpnB